MNVWIHARECEHVRVCLFEWGLDTNAASIVDTMRSDRTGWVMWQSQESAIPHRGLLGRYSHSPIWDDENINPKSPNGWFMGLFTWLSYRAVTTKTKPPFLWHRCALCTASFPQQKCGVLRRTPVRSPDHWQHWRTLAVRFQSAHWDNENTMTTKWFLRRHLTGLHQSKCDRWSSPSPFSSRLNMLPVAKGFKPRFHKKCVQTSFPTTGIIMQSQHILIECDRRQCKNQKAQDYICDHLDSGHLLFQSSQLLQCQALP